MKNKTKKWLVTAASLVLAGLIIFAVVMTLYDWDFNRLSTQNYQTNTYNINQQFSSITINTDTADIVFAVSQDGTSRVECYEQQNFKHMVTVSDNVLFIKENDSKKWYDNIGINFKKTNITIYLPGSEYSSLNITESTSDIKIPDNFKFNDVNITLSTGDVEFYASALEDIKIQTSTGDICAKNVYSRALELTTTTGAITLSNVNCEGDISLKVSTGKTNLNRVNCKNLISYGTTGDISLNNVIATETFLIERNTGDVEFTRSDANEIKIKTSTGKVEGSLLSDKIFFTQTSTGEVDVPKTTTGGKCEITTSTGDIEIIILTVS